MSSDSNNGIAAAIIFAGLVVAAGLVFVGLQMDGGVAIDKAGKDAKAEVVADKGDEVKKDEEVKLPEDPMAANVRPVDADYDHIRGDEDARITIVEYSDYDCPYCTQVHPTLSALVEDYDGKVNWVYRHFPLSIHEPSASAKAEAAECVAEIGGNDKFWAYSDALYDGGATGEEDSLVKLAASIGVDKAKFQKCLDEDKFEKRIADDIENGSDAGVNGTPGNIIIDNKTGKEVSVIGAQPKANFKKVIDLMLQM